MYDEKFPTAIVKAQVDIINVFFGFCIYYIYSWNFIINF